MHIRCQYFLTIYILMEGNLLYANYICVERLAAYLTPDPAITLSIYEDDHT